MSRRYYCPSCGKDTTTRVIETVPSEDEEKDVCTCDYCGNIFNVFRDRWKSSPSVSVTNYGGAPEGDHE